MSADIFRALADTTGEILARIAEQQFAPEETKNSLRSFYTSEVAGLLGISTGHLKRIAEEGKIPAGDRDSRGWRHWQLADVHEMRRVLGRETHKPLGVEPTVIAVANFKGGVAKTTVAVNLAQYLTLHGLRTTLIDLDSQGSATSMMGVRPEIDVTGSDTILEFLMEEKDDLSSVVRKTHWPGLDLIPASLELYNAELELPTKNAREEHFTFWNRLERGIETLYPATDVVILDCPPSLGYLSMNALWAANAVVMPIPPKTLDLHSAQAFFSMVADTLDGLNQADRKATGRISAKQYDFTRILVSRYVSQSHYYEALSSLMADGYGDLQMVNVLVETAVVSNSRGLTPLEMESYDGSKRTLTRALDSFDRFGQEIKDLVMSSWRRKAAERPSQELSA